MSFFSNINAYRSLYIIIYFIAIFFTIYIHVKIVSFYYLSLPVFKFFDTISAHPSLFPYLFPSL